MNEIVSGKKAVVPELDNVQLPTAPRKLAFKLVLAAIAGALPLFIYLFLLSVMAVLGVVVAFDSVTKAIESASGIVITLSVISLVLFVGLLVLLSRPMWPVKVQRPSIQLEKGQAPELFDYVSGILQSLAGLTLDSINVTMDVATDMYFSTVTAYREKRVTVDIGAPLLELLSKQELTALLIHETCRYHKPGLAKRYIVIRLLRAHYDALANRGEDPSRHTEQRRAIARRLMAPVVVFDKFVGHLAAGVSGFAESSTQSAIHEVAFLADSAQVKFSGGDQFAELLNKLARIDQAFHLTLEEEMKRERASPLFASHLGKIFHENPLKTAHFVEMAPSEHFNGWRMLPSPHERMHRIKSLENPVDVSDANTSTESHLLVKEWVPDLRTVDNAVTQMFFADYGMEVEDLEKEGDTKESQSKLAQQHDEAICKKFTSGLFRKDLIWDVPPVSKFTNLPPEKIIPFLNKVVISIRHKLPELTQYVSLRHEYQRLIEQQHLFHWLIKDGSKLRPPAETIDELRFTVKDFEEKHLPNKNAYRKSYGTRVSAAIALGRSNRAYRSADQLVSILSRLSDLQEVVDEAKVKCATINKLVARRKEVGDIHDATIVRLTKMVLKVVEGLELRLSRIPPSIAGECAEVIQRVLDTKAKDVVLETRVPERFAELLKCYEVCNTAISAKLALFVSMVEKKQAIETVTVARPTKARNAS